MEHTLNHVIKVLPSDKQTIEELQTKMKALIQEQKKQRPPLTNIYLRKSDNEATCVNALKKFDPNIKVQYLIPGSAYIADFFLPSKNLIVEVNGPTHYIKRIENGLLVVSDELNGRS